MSFDADLFLSVKTISLDSVVIADNSPLKKVPFRNIPPLTANMLTCILKECWCDILLYLST